MSHSPTLHHASQCSTFPQATLPNTSIRHATPHLHHPCYVTLPHAKPLHITLHLTTPIYATLRSATLPHTTPYYSMLFHATPCYSLLLHASLFLRHDLFSQGTSLTLGFRKIFTPTTPTKTTKTTTPTQMPKMAPADSDDDDDGAPVALGPGVVALEFGVEGEDLPGAGVVVGGSVFNEAVVKTTSPVVEAALAVAVLASIDVGVGGH